MTTYQFAEHAGSTINWTSSDSLTFSAAFTASSLQFTQEGVNLLVSCQGSSLLLASTDILDLVDGSFIFSNGSVAKFGSAENDSQIGSELSDLVYGNVGNDMIFGESGGDLIHGGSGNDVISGGEGADQITGGDGDDVIYGFGETDIAAASGHISASLLVSSLSRPLSAASRPEEPDRLFVVEQHTGKIQIVDLATGSVSTTPFLDVPDSEFTTASSQGVLSIAFSPDYENNQTFYVLLSNATGDIEIRSYQTSLSNSDVADPSSMTVIMTIPHDNIDSHYGGWMGFGPDGYLYVSTGDGSSGEDPANNAQNADVLLGKILRIDVSQDAFTEDPSRNYAIPTDNPFVNQPGADEIWAVGLRNPWRASFDRSTGDLYIADVGQALREEINVQLAGSSGGANYGWKIKEGSLIYDDTILGNPPATTPPLTDPIYEYSHGPGPTGGFSVTGGYVYRGTAAGMQGVYFFADYVTNQLWSFRLVNGTVVDAANRTSQLQSQGGTVDKIVSFAEDGYGNLYALGLDGEIFEFRPGIGAGDSADTIDGGTGNDLIFGGAGNDALGGGEGDDQLWGGIGNDILDGSDGSDTINYEGQQADYLVADLGVNGINVIDLRATAVEGIDLVTNVELISFSDGVFDLSSLISVVGVTITGTAGVDLIDSTNTVLGQFFPTDQSDTIFGLGGNDTISALGGDDRIDGGIGNDTMVGGTGNDTYVVGATGDIVDETGGDGTDTVESTVTLSLSSATQIKGDVENLTLLGTGAINGTGNGLANVITGNSGNNILAGLGGADTLEGGLGLDTASYAASGSGVTVSLEAGVAGQGGDAEGDTLSGIENLTGSNHNDTLAGNSGDNVLTGGLGIDTVSYAAATAGVTVSLALATAQNTIGAGTDTLSGMDNLTGSTHDDVLTGSTAANTITGGDGNDRLDGGTGNDTMVGGTGNDTYVVGATGDIVDETGGDGTDTVESTVTLSLSSATQIKGDVENLTLLGTGAINGTGNGLANVITGNSGNNILAGLGGADTLEGGLGLDTASYAASGSGVTVSLEAGVAGQGGDAEGDTLSGIENLTGSNHNDTLAGNSGDNVLTGGLGIDTVSYAAATAGVTVSLALATAQNTLGAGTDTLSGMDNLTGSAHDDVLTGSTAANTITGGDGNDRLDGGTGNDTMVGGTGNDTYVVGATGDIVDETGGDGTDTVESTVTLSLSSATQIKGDVENLTLLGTGAINGTGNGLANVITGNSGNNILAGLGGADTLEGGAGNDMLDGGSGYDMAIFDAAKSYYLITQISVGVYEVSDMRVESPHGTDTIYGVEEFEFSGIRYTADQLLNSPPVLANLIVDQNATEGASFSFVVPANSFVDPDFGDELSYSASLFSGAPLPSWLTFHPASREFSGIPDDADVGSLEVRVTVTDGSGATAFDDFTITVADTLNAVSGTSASDLLVGTSEGDSIQGLGGNDTISALGGDDRIDGGIGNDTMVGGTGNDTYVVGATGDIVDETGGDGTDTVESTVTLSLSSATQIKGDVENLTLLGTGAINGTGNGLANVITGNSGNNILAGLGGADTLEGGLGLDTASYAASGSGVTVSLEAGVAGQGGDAEGDTLSGIENLTGSNHNDTLAGNSGDNVLTGGLGIDTVSYAAATAGVTVSLALTTAQNTLGAGLDKLATLENLTGSTHDDVLTGSTAANTITGGDGNDRLDGGTGNDTMVGGTGNDTYVVGATGDIVDETGGDGTDTVESTVTLSLSSATQIKGDVENLTLLGTGAINGTGNGLANVITGNSGNNILAGLGGADTLEGGLGLDTASYAASGSGVTVSLEAGVAGQGGDAEGDTLSGIENLTGSNHNDTLAGNSGDNVLTGGLGIDTVSYAAATAGVTVSLALATAQNTIGAGTDTLSGMDNLTGSTHDDVLTGSTAANTITGGDGNDRLDGGTGNDTMVGGTGNDTYVVGATGDIVDETGGDGTDTVESTVTLSLSSATQIKGDVENLTLLGTGAINGTGNGLANVITGNSGNNILAGLGGADTLEGGLGLDTASYAASGSGVTVSLEAGVAGQGGDAEGDTLSGIENLTGSNHNDTLAGNSGDNVLTGGLGIDTVSYAAATAGVTVSLALATAQNTIGAGLDKLATLENLTGSTHDDVLTGSTAANTITGGDGNDRLDGGTGNDTMVGGTGNDTYVVGATGDIVDETGGDGTDTVESTVTLSLSSATQIKGDVENLTLLGTGAINGTGNGLANVITGNSGNNILAGLGGADTLEGGLGLDTASYAASGSGVTVSLEAGVAGQGGDAEGDTLSGIENLTGSNHNDTLAGNSGDNVLTGGLGIDTVSYAAATAGVTVSLALATAQNTIGAGTDTLSGMDNLTGSAHDDVLTGSTAANTITGGDGADTINAGGGNDIIAGGLGIDLLTGSTGADRFDFSNIAEAGDIVTDFVTGSDKIDVSLLLDTEGLGSMTLTDLLNGGYLSTITGNVVTGTVTNSATTLDTQLLFDEDGSVGPGSTFVIVTLEDTTIASGDFLV